MSQKLLVTEWEGMYPNRREEGARGTDGCLSRRKSAGDLGDIQDLDERIQGWEDTITPCRF